MVERNIMYQQLQKIGW